MEPMRVYLLHSDPEAERKLRPVVHQLGGMLRTLDGIRALYDQLQSREPADCLVTDVFPGNECALEFLPALKQQHSDLPVIIWSANLDVSTGVELMRLGAHTVIEFPSSQPTLLLTLHQALHESGQMRLRSQREGELRGKLDSLSEGEREVMQLLFDGKTNKEIAEQLAVSRRTVEARRQRIVKIAGVPNLIGLVVKLAEHGLLQDARAGFEADRQTA
jgi:RNA polymerase sigma factor (sigma-70 family)